MITIYIWGSPKHPRNVNKLLNPRRQYTVHRFEYFYGNQPALIHLRVESEIGLYIKIHTQQNLYHFFVRYS